MGVIIRNGINYSNESFVEVTQAQYDALSDAEKMNGTVYLIDDGLDFGAKDIPYGSGSVADALDKGEVYDYDTEHRVGTWVNGKPIYRKTIRVVNAQVNNQATYPHGIENIETVMNVHAVLRDSNSTQFNAGMPYPLITSDGTEYLGLSISRTHIWWRGTATYTASAARSHFITIDYTKTTD